MKTIFLKSTLLAVISASLFTSCVKDDNFDAPTLDGCTETTLVKNREVIDITFGTTVQEHENITPGVSDVIEAYVVSSDIGGNFFKSISFQTLDKSLAFSIPVDATSTFINYEPGRKVLIKMDGLYTDNPSYPAQTGTQGKRIGGLYANSTGGAEVGRLPLNQFINSVQRSCTTVDEDDLVQYLTIGEAINDNNLNKLIELQNVQFEITATNSTYYDYQNEIGGATNYTIIDLEGNTTIFRTSGYANFASKPVASGSGTIRGVLTKYGDGYQFMVRSENDIKLEGERFIPLLNEKFDTGMGEWSSFSVTGAQEWSYSSSYGFPGCSSCGGMMKMSGYAGGNQNNEDWLISPVQDLTNMTAGATLSFENAYKFTGPAIVALISNDYSGTGNPNLATWTVLSGAILSTGSYVYANSGELDITNFTGSGNDSVYVAFKYTSTTSGASTWEIDNVKITPQ